MNNTSIKYIGLTFVYVATQILVLNKILFFTYINPFLYILLIITLPLSTPKWMLLIYAFILGLLIDVFCGSLGFHSTATVLISFIKPLISKITIPHNILSDTNEITLKKIGLKSFIIFSSLLIIIHNCCLFLLTHLDINLSIFLKIIASSFITLILILITQLFEQEK